MGAVAGRNRESSIGRSSEGKRVMDIVQKEMQRYRDRRKKPWATLRRRADGLWKAARTAARQGNLALCAGMNFAAARMEIKACKLEMEISSVGKIDRKSTRLNSS